MHTDSSDANKPALSDVRDERALAAVSVLTAAPDDHGDTGPPPAPAMSPSAIAPAVAGLSRRAVLQSAGAATALSVSVSGTSNASAQGGATPALSRTAQESRSLADVNSNGTARPVTLRINGTPITLTLEARVTLLDALREYAGLPGTKKGCDRGQCGACTVLVDGQRINACLTLAVMQEGVEITTIEGLGTPEALHPMQAAFIEHDAFQCGYCTPGQICSAVALVNEHRLGQASAVTPDVRALTPALSDDEIRERMSGNLCRCGAYPNIVAAVRSVVQPRRGAA